MLTMEEAMKQTGSLPFAAGNIVKGKIIEVRPKEVLVDIGYKSEGVIPGSEFQDIKTVKVGDEIEIVGLKPEVRKTTVTGVELFAVVPLPSWPAEPLPQHLTVPPESKAGAWAPAYPFQERR